jgi:enoyl-CoA hydratase/carnithine racemase
MPGHVHLLSSDAHGVAVLQFSNPGKLNALTVQMWRDLRALVEGLNTLHPEAGPRVVILRGDGGSFVAGADIEEFPDFRFDAETLAAYHEDVVAPALNALLDATSACAANPAASACRSPGWGFRWPRWRSRSSPA